VTPEALQRELREGRLRPAYLLLGEDAVSRDDALAALREAALGEGPADFNHDRLEGEGTTGPRLQDALHTLPAMATRRLVELREPEGGRGRDRGLCDAIADAVPSLADSPSVLVVLAGSADRRSRWVRAFRDPAAVVECAPPKNARELAAFIRAEAERQGLGVGAGVAQILAERVGPQPLLIRQELAKAALLAGEGRKVTREHVAAGGSTTAEDPIWDLTDAIGEGRRPDALAVLARLLRAGAPPPVVLASLATHFRKLLRIAYGGDAPGPPFVQRKLGAQARRYTPVRLRACLDAIHETDTALKGAGALRPELALERLVLGLSG